MPRLPTLLPSQMTSAQLAVHDAIINGPRGTVHGRGIGLTGPFNAWIRSPELADHAQRLGAFLRFNSQFPARLSELAIILVGKHWRASFEFAAHAPLALAAGLSADIIEAIRTGAAPSFANDDERIVHTFTTQLLQNNRVTDVAYDAALRAFGEMAVVELVSIIGYYCLVSLTLNAFVVPLREGMVDPFA